MRSNLVDPTSPPPPGAPRNAPHEYQKSKNASQGCEENVQEVSFEYLLEKVPWAVSVGFEEAAIAPESGRLFRADRSEDVEEFLSSPNTIHDVKTALKKWRRTDEDWERLKGPCYLLTPENDFAVVVLPNAYRKWKRIGGRQKEINGKKQWTTEGREVWEEKPTYEKVEEIKPRSLEILKDLGSFTTVAPNGVDLQVHILGELPEGAFEEFEIRRKKVRIYDRGRFCPMTRNILPGYELPIRNCQSWIDEHVPVGEAVKDVGEAVESKSRKPRTARITPVPVLPENLAAVVSRMRTAVWKAEFKTDENGERKKLRRARSPKTPAHEVIRWNPDDFEDEKHKWGSYSESYLAFERDEDLDGVEVLVEPNRMLRPEEEGSPYPVFLDVDDCRDPETGEITLPWVRDLLERLGTYAEASPSGKGIRIVGWARRDPRSKTDLKDVAEQLGARTDFQIFGASGGRRLVTITGRPLPDYDVPVRDIQDWVDEVVPLHEPSPETDGLVAPDPLNVEDEDLKQKMLASGDGDLMRRFFDGDETLWKGPESRYADRSKADVGFFQKLAWWTRHDRERMKRMAFSSKMRRKKWQRDGYLEDGRGGKGIITLGIEGCRGSYYDPSYSSKPELVEKLWAARATLKDFDERASWGALLALGERYGTWSRAGFVWTVKNVGDRVTIPEKGMVVHAAVRTVMPLMGADSPAKAHEALEKIREAGYAKRVWKSKNNVPDLYLIPDSVTSKIPATESYPSLSPPPCLYLLCSKNESGAAEGEPGEARLGIYEKLVFIQPRRNERPGLNKKEKLVFELVLSDQITDLNEMAAFLGVDRKNLVRNVKVLVGLGLVGRDDDRLSLTDGFEHVIHDLFVDSGGERMYLDALDQIERHRSEHAAFGKEANAVGRQTPVEEDARRGSENTGGEEALRDHVNIKIDRDDDEEHGETALDKNSGEKVIAHLAGNMDRDDLNPRQRKKAEEIVASGGIGTTGRGNSDG